MPPHHSGQATLNLIERTTGWGRRGNNLAAESDGVKLNPDPGSQDGGVWAFHLPQMNLVDHYPS
jgi:hypothetical protein